MALETLTTTSATSTNTSDSDGTNASTNDSLFGGPGGLAPAPLIPAFLFTGLLVATILALMGYRKIMRNRAIERARLLGLYDTPDEPAEKKIPEIFDTYTAVGGQKSWRTLKPLSATFTYPSSSPARSPETANLISRRPPYFARRILFPSSFSTQPQSPNVETVHETKDSKTGCLQVAVLIALPSQHAHNTRFRRSCDTIHSVSSLKEKGDELHVEDVGEEIEERTMDVVLGLTYLPWTHSSLPS